MRPMFSGHDIRTRYHDQKALTLHEAHPALEVELGARTYTALAVEAVCAWIGYDGRKAS